LLSFFFFGILLRLKEDAEEVLLDGFQAAAVLVGGLKSSSLRALSDGGRTPGAEGASHERRAS